MLKAVTQSVAAASARVLDGWHWATPVLGMIGLLGWAWVAIIGGLAVYALARGTYGFIVAVAAMVVVRGLYVWAGISARARHRARTIGDPTVYHEDWLYRPSEPVRGRDWMRCIRCRRRLRPGERTVEGIAPVPAPAPDLPAVLQESPGTSHAGFIYCKSCGGTLRQRQGDETARSRALLRSSKEPRTPAPTRPFNSGLRRGSAVALALSFAALVLIPSLSVVALVLLFAILVGSLFGLGVARHGWALYGENPPLLVFLSLALLALAVPVGLQLWATDHPQPEPIPGAVPLKPVFVDGTAASGVAGAGLGPDNRSVDAVMLDRERAQDALALNLVAAYDGGTTDVAWWRSEAGSSAKLAALVRRYRADGVRVRDPVLRRRYLEISAARQRYAAELGRLQQAMARGDRGEAKLAELRARIAGDEAARLRATLFIGGGPG